MIKRILVNLGLLVFSVLVVLLLFEGVLRMFFPIYSPGTIREHENEDIMQYDEKYGWFHKKDFKTWIETQEYDTTVYLNPKGLRGKEYDYAKPAGVKRIVVLGDSLSFGLGVNDTETFSVKLEELFKKEGKNVEVINMGVDGFSTDQELLLLREEGMKYSPDAVVCQFYLGNDVEGNSMGLMYGKNKPYFLPEAGGGITLENYPVPEAVQDTGAARIVNEPRGRINVPFVKEFLNKHSYAFIFCRLRYNNLLYKLGVRKSVSEQISDQGLDVTERLFLEMKKMCDENNARFLLFLVPTREQMSGAEPAGSLRDLIEFAGKNNIKYLDFMETARGKKDINFVIDCHWNIKGNEYVAEVLYSRLKDIVK